MSQQKAPTVAVYCRVATRAQLTLYEGAKLRDLLDCPPPEDCPVIKHAKSQNSCTLCCLRELTPLGRKDFARLLRARIGRIEFTDTGTELYLEDVPVTEFERFIESYEAHQRISRLMGTGL